MRYFYWEQNPLTVTHPYTVFRLASIIGLLTGYPVFMCHSKLFTYEYTAAFVLSFLFHLSLLYCHYCSVMHVTVMPVSAYMALAFVFGFIQIN